MEGLTHAAGFGLCDTRNPELGSSCVAFAALEQEGGAGLEHDTGEWDLTAMWQQIYAAFKHFSHFFYVFRSIHKFVWSFYVSRSNYGPFYC